MKAEVLFIKHSKAMIIIGIAAILVALFVAIFANQLAGVGDKIFSIFESATESTQTSTNEQIIMWLCLISPPCMMVGFVAFLTKSSRWRKIGAISSFVAAIASVVMAVIDFDLIIMSAVAAILCAFLGAACLDTYGKRPILKWILFVFCAAIATVILLIYILFLLGVIYR